MIGISIRPTIGMGDQLQFSSLPENYFQATGQKLIDVSKPWFFDANPYVIRDQIPDKIIEMWNFGPKQWDWPEIKDRKTGVYLSNAEIWCSVLEIPCVMNRPRLYRFETQPYWERDLVLLQTEGRSHGGMPDHVVEHIMEKYGTHLVVHIGPGYDQLAKRYRVQHMDTPDPWDLARFISSSRMLIGLDSGPAWIGACYPDVVVKKLRMKPSIDVLKDWTPLEMGNIHSHWDDRCHQIFNPSEEDVGFTSSYTKI